jgi:cyclic beta-1,2-glucan synthetase
MRLRVTVTPTEDVEIQEIELTNEGSAARQVRVVGSLEPALARPEDVTRHPAFSKMFLRCTPLPDLAGALVTRLARDEHLAPRLVFRMVGGRRATPRLLTIDRRAFFGRNPMSRTPAALHATPGEVEGGTLDPLCSSCVDLTIPPGASRAVALVTAVANRGSEAIELARRFGTLKAARWAFEDAEGAAVRRVERLALAPELLPATQRLLSALLLPDEERRAP